MRDGEFPTKSMNHYKQATAYLVIAFILFGTGNFARAQTPGKGIERVRIGTPSPASIAVLQIKIAEVKGFLRDEGIQAEIVQMRVPVSLVALMTKDVDYATPTGTLLVSAVKALPLRVAMYFLRAPLHVLNAKPEIRTVAELKGKTVGIGGIGEATEPMLKAMLRTARMDSEKDIKVLQVSGSGSRFAGLSAGLMDAAVLPPPYNLQAEAQGYRRLTSVAAAPEVLDGTIALAPPTGLGVNVEKLQSNPGQIKRMIRAFLKSHNFIRSQKSETTKILSEWLKLDPAMAAGAYDMFAGAMSGDGLVKETAVTAAVDQVRQELKLKQPIASSNVIDFTILKEALTEMGGMK
jgi:ABC-type nitrate/sulfonate/bicarbonate transport system substrate-binding protein